MAEISRIQAATTAVPVGRVVGGAARDGRADTGTAIRRGVDKVEVSEVATYLSKLKQLPAVRQDLVDHVRRQIAEGTYETPEKIDSAVDQLMQDLG